MMTEENKKRRENKVLELLDQGYTYNEVVKLIRKTPSWRRTSLETVKRIKRDQLIIEYLNASMSRAQIVEKMQEQGFAQVTIHVVDGLSYKHKIKRDYSKAISHIDTKNLSDRNRFVIELRKQNYSSTQINQMLIENGYGKISRQRVEQIIKRELKKQPATE